MGYPCGSKARTHLGRDFVVSLDVFVDHSFATGCVKHLAGVSRIGSSHFQRFFSTAVSVKHVDRFVAIQQSFQIVINSKESEDHSFFFRSEEIFLQEKSSFSRFWLGLGLI